MLIYTNADDVSLLYGTVCNACHCVITCMFCVGILSNHLTTGRIDAFSSAKILA